MRSGVEKYNITGENTYNWDEKGFIIGQAARTQRIMTSEALEAGRITFASQDGSREFISLLACISATGVALPPALIYKGDSTTLQSSWIEDWVSEDLAHFAVSTNGWSCNALGLHWLQAIFHRYTIERAGRSRRLLIVDGHSSHVNLQFVELCDKLRILLLILPPHTTHRLQPLDVSLFGPLATFYTNGLNQLASNSLGMVSMTKRAFWSCFWSAWQQAFTEKNIASGFQKTGIWPINPEPMLAKLTRPASVMPNTPTDPKTPMTCRAVRRIGRVYRKAPTSIVANKVLRAAEKLSSQHAIDQHTINGLTQALRDEKKRRQRGKRLNLLGENDSGAQFFSPGRIQAAREWQTQKATNEATRQQEIANAKALAVTKKAQKEADKLQRSIASMRRRQLAAEVKVQKAINRQAQQELKQAASTIGTSKSGSYKQSGSTPKGPKPIRKQIDSINTEKSTAQQKEVVLVTSRGRHVHRPLRFDN